jgi:hypothetical protein
MSAVPQRQCRAVPQKPCSAPPKRRPAAYDRRPGAAPERVGRSHRPTADSQGIRVIVPADPPVLTPAAARAFLRILIDARERALTTEPEGKERP